jgi:hypoxanthine phosphoribosyltransferase
MEGHKRLISELKFEVPSWNQIYDMLIELSQKIRGCGFNPEVIVGISRGGWLPSRILSDLLENPYIASVTAEFYVGVYETNCEPRLTQPIPISVFDKKILLVDDVADSGRSAMLIRDYLCREGVKELKILTLYYKPWSRLAPDFYSKETSDWIVFPWEIKETLRKLQKKCTETNEPFKNAVSKLTEAGVNKELIEHLLSELSEHKNPRGG